MSDLAMSDLAIDGRARAIEAEIHGEAVPPDCDFPTIDDGVAGMAFIQTAVASAKGGGAWTGMAPH